MSLIKKNYMWRALLDEIPDHFFTEIQFSELKRDQPVQLVATFFDSIAMNYYEMMACKMHSGQILDFKLQYLDNRGEIIEEIKKTVIIQSIQRSSLNYNKEDDCMITLMLKEV